MKKALILFLIAPLGLFAQDIINTLGASGEFFVNNSNDETILEIDQTVNNPIIFGRQPTGFNAASLSGYGTLNIINETFPTALDLTAAGGGSAVPAIQLFRAGGNLQSNGAQLQNPVVNTEIGVLNFGAYNGSTGSGTWKVYSSIFSTLVTSASTGSGNNSTKLVFQTTQANGTTENNMTFDNTGSLIVPGAVISQGISDPILNATTYVAGLAEDYILPAVIGSGTVELPSSAEIGKTYVIKLLSAGTLTIDPESTNTIDGQPSIDLTAGNQFVKVLKRTATEWVVIGQGDGF